MRDLCGRDAALILEALSELYALGPVESFPACALRVVRRVVGCEEASFNEIDLVSGAYRVLVDPAENAISEVAPQFAVYMHEHPVIAHVAAGGDPGPRAISDFLRPAEFRRLGLHGEFFAPLGIEDQLSTSLTVTPGKHVIGVALDRASRFGERERRLLEALRPHLLNAYRNALAYSETLARRERDEESCAGARTALARLSDRQREVLALVSDGYTNAQVAAELGIRVATVKKHLEHILARLGVGTRLAAARVHLAASAAPGAERWWILDGTATRTLAEAAG